MMIAWDANTAIDIREWLICRGGQVERFHHILTNYAKSQDLAQNNGR